MVDLEVFDPSEPALLDCLRFCFISAPSLWNYRHMISIATAETDEFFDITKLAPSDFSDEFGEFAEALINENILEMPRDSSSVFNVFLYLLSKIEEYS